MRKLFFSEVYVSPNIVAHVVVLHCVHSLLARAVVVTKKVSQTSFCQKLPGEVRRCDRPGNPTVCVHCQLLTGFARKGCSSKT